MAFLHRHRWLNPYLLLLPGMAFLALFFAVPLGFSAYQSLHSHDPISFTDTFSWAWGNYSDAFDSYDSQLIRSFEYAAIATGIALVLSYPLAYFIAFRGGRWKNLLLLFIIGPFFVTYLIRTLAWQNILADEGPVVSLLHHLGYGGRVLDTSVSVVAGITYNFLPFMALPLYVSLEQIDQRLVEAAKDLYSSTAQAFLRVTLPLSMPGVVAGTLLTFIPAAGDFVNAQLLGTPKQFMIGNVIQSNFENGDFPLMAAVSFVLMAIMLVLIVVYARVVGTEKLSG